MASSSASPTHLMDVCLNCMVYNWVQPDPSILQKCKQCKIVQYCGIDCQAEHWKACHKKHCRELVATRVAWREGDPPVHIGSHPDYPAIDLHGDPTENLVLLVMQVIGKMKQTDHPAFSMDVPKALLQQIWNKMAGENLNVIYTYKRIYPPGQSYAAAAKMDDPEELLEKIKEISFDDIEDQLGLWKTLKLILFKLVKHQNILAAQSLKELDVSVPEELRHCVEKEVGLFPGIVDKIIEAFTSSGPHQFPTFQQLLEIMCGGNLNQTCMSCNKQIVVSASGGPDEAGPPDEAGGPGSNIHNVIVHPYLPRMFFCGETLCVEESKRKIWDFAKWFAAVGTALVRLAPNRCDFCFKLSEKVHR